MRTRKTVKRFLSILFIVGLVAACSKDGDQGPIGPQGAQGEQGPAGPQGEDGQDGADGETGTANVIYSDWIVSEFEDDIIATASSFNVDAPELTQEIMDTGVILSYGKDEFAFNGTAVYQLPYIDDDNQYFIRLSELGMVRFRISSLDGTSIGTPFFEEYRYIIIPGGNPTTAKSTDAVDYSKMTYEVVIAYFNIPE